MVAYQKVELILNLASLVWLFEDTMTNELQPRLR